MSTSPRPYAMPRFAADALLRDLSAALEEVKRRWYLFGAQAVAVHGRPRLTADVDATVDAEPSDASLIERALSAHGFEARVPDVERFVERTRVLPLVHTPSALPLDLVFAGPGLEQEFLDNARVETIGAVEVPVIAAEDLVVAKVLAGRPRDLEDVRGILLERAGGLDRARIDGFLELLDEALDRSDLRPALAALEPGPHAAGRGRRRPKRH